MADFPRHNKFISTLRLAAAWLFIVFYATPVIVFSILTCRRFTDRILPPVARMWSAVMLRLLGIEVEFENTELLQVRRARVIIWNHESTLDILWLGRIFPPAAVGIVKREFLYVPVFNLALWSAGFVFINRANRQKAVGALQALSSKIVREKRSLLIAPEGTRTRTGEMLPFKKGAFRIAAGAGIPLYPVVVAGAFTLLPKPRIVPRPGKMRVICLPPIDTAGWDENKLDDKVQEVRESMLQARRRLEEKLRTA